MKATYEKGHISFSLEDALQSVDAEQIPDLLQSLSCETKVIDYVAQQIINRWTEDGYHGYTGLAHPQQYSGLDKAWRDVAKASGEIAKREIERLEDALSFAEKQYQSAVNELNELRSKRYEFR